MDVGHTMDLNYRLRQWAPTSASLAVSAVDDLLVSVLWYCLKKFD